MFDGGWCGWVGGVGRSTLGCVTKLAFVKFSPVPVRGDMT